MTDLHPTELAERIHVAHVRDAVPNGHHVVYVGRAMPGREGSVFGNPLPVRGRTWTPAAQAWTAHLATHAELEVREAARAALLARGYAQGEAATFYRHVLRAQCREAHSPQRTALLRLARLVAAGETLTLQCWCAPQPCHAAVIRDAILGYARRLSA